MTVMLHVKYERVFSVCWRETRERMEAMEKQIASLTGLLQRVLSRAPEAESP